MQHANAERSAHVHGGGWISIDRSGLDITIHMDLDELVKHRDACDAVIATLTGPREPCTKEGCWYCEPERRSP